MKIDGYTIRYARTTSGKAGKGRNKTSTVQVFSGDFMLRHFRFTMGSTESRTAAVAKAHKFVDQIKS